MAYFSKGADSKSLFEPLKCVKDTLFLENMNAYDTIFVDIQACFKEAEEIMAAPNQYIRSGLINELKAAYPKFVSKKAKGLLSSLTNGTIPLENLMRAVLTDWHTQKCCVDCSRTMPQSHMCD